MMKNFWNLLKWKFENSLSMSMMVTILQLIHGSALGGLNGEAEWVDKIDGINGAVDTWIRIPQA
jgi:ABC-type dipeptide/oligopeptide/nickel transport system permease subunit